MSKPNDASRRGRIRRLVALLAPLPDPFATHEQYVEFNNLDLPGLPPSRLLYEKNRLQQLLLIFGDAMDPWHVRRLRALEARLRDAR